MSRVWETMLAWPDGMFVWLVMAVSSQLPLLTVMAVLLTGAMVLRGWWRVGALMMAPVVAVLVMGGLGLLVSGESPSRHEGTLRVASLNVMVIGTEDDAKLAFMRESRAEVVSLVELYPRLRKRLGELQDVYPYVATHDESRNYSLGYGQTLGLLSKHPLKRVARWGPELVMYRVEAPEPFYVVQVHPAAPANPPRLQQRARDWDVLEGAALPERVVMLGDFNTVPWDGALHGFMRASGLRLVGTRWPTFPSFLPLVPIDLVMTRNGEGRVVRVKVPGTDHLAVVSDVVLENKESVTHELGGGGLQ